MYESETSSDNELTNGESQKSASEIPYVAGLLEKVLGVLAVGKVCGTEIIVKNQYLGTNYMKMFLANN